MRTTKTAIAGAREAIQRVNPDASRDELSGVKDALVHLVEAVDMLSRRVEQIEDEANRWQH